jgi:hypothetical protein
MRQRWLLSFGLGLASATLLGCGTEVRLPDAATAGAAAGGQSVGTGGVAGAAPNNVAGQGGAGAGASGEAGATAVAGAAGSGEADCGAAALDDLVVYAAGGWDPLGYPPYALDDCTLVYVAGNADGTGGDLHLRELATGNDVVLAEAALHPRRPTLAGAVLAWEDAIATGSQVHVRYSGGPQVVEFVFENAGEPRSTFDAVVFTAFVGAGVSGDTDVHLFDVATHEVTPVATGAGQQRFADVSPTHIAFTDFSEDPHGYFNEAGSISDVAVIERSTGQRTLRAAPGKQAFPLLGAEGALSYLEWGAVHPEPKFSQFKLKAGQLGQPVESDINVKGGDALVSTNPAYVRPSLHGAYLDFVDEVASSPQLFRVALGSAAPPALVAIPGAARLFGPVATERLTLVAKPLQGSALALVAVSR